MTSQITFGTDVSAPRRAPNRRTDLIGYRVGVVGGSVGTVDPATADVAPGNLVIRIGRLARRRVVVPAGAVNCVDHLSRRVHLQADRGMVSDAPRHEPGRSVTSPAWWPRTMQQSA